MEPRHDAGLEMAKVIPPIGAVGLQFGGVPLSDLVLLATLLYTTLMIGHLLYKWGKELFEETAGEEE